MLYLLWSVADIGLAFIFLFICFKAVKLIKGKMGMAAAIVFIIGMIALMNNSANSFNSKPEVFVFEQGHAFDYDSGNESFDAVLDSSLVFDINLFVLYNGNEANKLTPISAYSRQTGLIGTVTWIAEEIRTTMNDTGINYYVYGNIEWRVLGNTVYIENKSYSGIISTK
jgi:hypothetical protein